MQVGIYSVRLLRVKEQIEERLFLLRVAGGYLEEREIRFKKEL